MKPTALILKFCSALILSAAVMAMFCLSSMSFRTSPGDSLVCVAKMLKRRRNDPSTLAIHASDLAADTPPAKTSLFVRIKASWMACFNQIRPLFQPLYRQAVRNNIRLKGSTDPLSLNSILLV